MKKRVGVAILGLGVVGGGTYRETDGIAQSVVGGWGFGGQREGGTFVFLHQEISVPPRCRTSAAFDVETPRQTNFG